MAAQRLAEVRRSRAHERVLMAAGGREHARWQVRAMVVLHSAWLLAAVFEVWLFTPPFRPWLAVVACGGLATGQWLRRAAMRALGHRWTVRVITLPGVPVVVGGPYRYIRHPNYLGVVLEIACLPLVHGALWTAAVFSAANGALLVLRIRAEEAALAADSADESWLAGRGRFLPSQPGNRA